MFPFTIASKDALYVCVYILYDIMKYKSLFLSYYVFIHYYCSELKKILDEEFHCYKD